MAENTSINQEFSNLVLFFWSKRRYIAFTTLIGAVMAIIITLLMPNRYKAEGVIFIPSSVTTSKLLMIDEQPFGEKDALYGIAEEEQVDQSIQILVSRRLRDKLIEKLKLDTYFAVDKKSATYEFEIQKRFDEAIFFSRNNLNALEVKAIDKNPAMAANLVNSIIDLYDETRREIFQERGKKAITTIQLEITHLDSLLTVMEDSMKPYQAKGLLEYERTADRYAESYSKGLVAGGNVSSMKNEYANIAPYICKFKTFYETHENGIKTRNTLLNKLRQLTVDTEISLSQKFVVDRAVQPDKKSAPNRILIVISITLATFVLSLFGVLMNEKTKQLKKLYEESFTQL